MASIDVFNSAAFSMASLTDAIETAPYKPGLLGSLGIFEEKPIRTTVAWVEKRKNTLRILSTANRGTMKDVRSTRARTAVPLDIPHVPYFGTIIANDIQNIRAFGSESELEAVVDHVNDELEAMRDDHEVTHEYHRIGALKGTILDGDASTVIYNLFTVFGLSQTNVNWLGTDASFAPTATTVIRTIADKLGSGAFNGIVAICGNTYFDAVVSHASMKSAYERWRDGEFLRESHMGKAWFSAAASGFMYQNILFINYRGKIGDVTFIPDTEAYYFPTGIKGLFQEIIAPADFMETVNTKGRRIYVKQEPMRFNKGVELHTQSNVLPICTRPDVVIKSTYAPA